jgi:nicotinamidase-related amidase
MPLPTLIVIDTQQAFEDGSWGERNNPDMERRLATALDAWRERGAPIVHVRHQSPDPDGRFIPGTPGFDYKPEAMPREGEPEITKTVNNAFVGTDLEERLRADGAEVVAVAGLTTDHCCSTTARMASDLGFETWVLEDALATHERVAPDGSPIPAETMHRTELASLSGEFAEVLDVAAAVRRLDEWSSSR